MDPRRSACELQRGMVSQKVRDVSRMSCNIVAEDESLDAQQPIAPSVKDLPTAVVLNCRSDPFEYRSDV